MKLNNFRKLMKKGIFSSKEAHLTAFPEKPSYINLQMHQWQARGEIIKLKRGLFMFSNYKPTAAEAAKALYEPCYFSMEYILNLHGILPESVFSYTLVTPKKTRHFKTPVGDFIFHTIKKVGFTGYDHQTLQAEAEKALADYFYINTSRLKTGDEFWKETRLNGANLHFEKIFRYAKLFGSKKMIYLLTDFQRYAKTHSNNF